MNKPSQEPEKSPMPALKAPTYPFQTVFASKDGTRVEVHSHNGRRVLLELSYRDDGVSAEMTPGDVHTLITLLRRALGEESNNG